MLHEPARPSRRARGHAHGPAHGARAQARARTGTRAHRHARAHTKAQARLRHTGVGARARARTDAGMCALRRQGTTWPDMPALVASQADRKKPCGRGGEGERKEEGVRGGGGRERGSALDNPFSLSHSQARGSESLSRSLALSLSPGRTRGRNIAYHLVEYSGSVINGFVGGI